MERRRKQEEDERLEAEERARQARKPRHDDLALSVLLEPSEPTEEETRGLRNTLNFLTRESYPRRTVDSDAFSFKGENKEKAEVEELRNRLQNMKVVSRAKVTQDRVYSAAYHPEKSKDIIFFGGMD